MKDSLVPDMYDKIEGESSGLGKLLSKIPGFDGYMERSRRREADQLLREVIASKLEQSRLRLAESQQELSHEIVRAISYSEDFGRADTRLMGLIGKIKDAPEGYAGFFDAVKVKEDDLAQLYSFDESMLAYSDEIVAQIDALAKAVYDGRDLDSELRELNHSLQEANAAFASRQEILAGFAQNNTIN